MAIKKSVRLNDATEKLCNTITRADLTNWSGALNTIAERYDILIRESLPALTKYEKGAICQSYNGHAKTLSALEETYNLSANVAEGWEYDQNVKVVLAADAEDFEDQKYIKNLLERIENWTIAEKIAVIDMTERFWS